MDQWKAEQGDSPQFVATLRDETGAVYSDYLGSETVEAVVWPGDLQPPISGAATATWLDASSGTITVAIVGAVTATLAPAKYFVKVEVDGAKAFQAQLILESAPGAGPARVAKIEMRHLKKFYPNIEKLLCKTDDPTALEARADSWNRLKRLCQRHYRGCSGLATDYRFEADSFGGAFYRAGYYRDGRRSRELEQWLDEGRLDITPELEDAMALDALSQILEVLVDPKGELGYADKAARFAQRSEGIYLTTEAEIDTDGDGVNDYTIRLGVADTLDS